MHIKHLADYLAHGRHAINVTTVFVIVVVMTPRSGSLPVFSKLTKDNLKGTPDSFPHSIRLLYCPVGLANWSGLSDEVI